jgi:hypothetical protein
MFHAPIVEHLTTAARNASHPTVLIACTLIAATAIAVRRYGLHCYANGYIDCAKNRCSCRR